MEDNSEDLKYIGDSTKKLIELKLLELETVISARKKEDEWLKKREIRAAQSDRINQARLNLNSLLVLEEKGKLGLEDYIEQNLNILREVTNIGEEDIVTCRENVDPMEKILDSFHITEKDMLKSFKKTNIMDVMRQAKKNGWEMRITENEVALYKDGKRISDASERIFIENSKKNDIKKQSREIQNMFNKVKKINKNKKDK
jgi:CHASE3 domain sensor protein